MTLRVDKWLFFVRVFKTRGEAAKACNGGHVHVNKERVKSSRALKVGDILEVTKGQLLYRFTVTSIPVRRGPAREAATFYDEDDLQRLAREERQAMLREDRARIPMTKGRPDKKTRRALRERKQS